jgi:S-(hydroxymethyl)glutathione dehydrogenase/alcohol dehydrogenase
MPDETSRFSDKAQMIDPSMGCSTPSNFTVLPEIAVAQVRPDAPFDVICQIGCGVTTAVGAVINTAKVTPGAKVIVRGQGGTGLNVIQRARMVGADKIVGVALNPDTAPWGKRFGMTLGQPEGGGGRHRRPSGRADRRRRW